MMITTRRNQSSGSGGHQQSQPQPLTPTPSRHGPNAGRDARSSTNTKKRFENAPTTMPPWQRLAKLCRREHSEEQRRAYRPPFPKVPTGWRVLHDAGTAYFTMEKDAGADRRSLGGNDEKITIFCAAAIKEPERTFRHDDGEREDPEHLNYTLFVEKPATGSSPHGYAGALEIQMTTIDHELVLDTVTVHATKEEYETAWNALVEGPVHEYNRDLRYRGPYIGELDEEFVDEILNYLDERGINNAFASYMQSQWHWFEQLEYEEWLTMYQTFSTPGITSVKKEDATTSTSTTTTEQETKNSTSSSNNNENSVGEEGKAEVKK